MLKFLSSISQSEALSTLFLSFPWSLAAGRLLVLGHEQAAFIQYVVCPNCHSLYDIEDCIEHIPGQEDQSKKCKYVKYPRHTIAKFRSPCGTNLMKKVKLKSGYTFRPFKIYSYQSLKSAVSKLIKQRGFIEQCEEWRSRGVRQFDQLCDIYDGNVWHDFETVNGTPFLSEPYSWCMTMNVD